MPQVILEPMQNVDIPTNQAVSISVDGSTSASGLVRLQPDPDDPQQQTSDLPVPAGQAAGFNTSTYNVIVTNVSGPPETALGVNLKVSWFSV